MKNIEDVIKTYECKKSIEDKCNECPYITECDDKYHCECEARDNDTIHYLKEYRDDRENFSEVISNCGKALNKYIMDIQALAQQEENTPLTWDELKQMEGKPVWIDSVPLVRRWVIIKKFHHIGGNKNLFDMEVEDGAHFLRKNMRRDDPAWWQAYRKERE